MDSTLSYFPLFFYLTKQQPVSVCLFSLLPHSILNPKAKENRLLEIERGKTFSFPFSVFVFFSFSLPSPVLFSGEILLAPPPYGLCEDYEQHLLQKVSYTPTHYILLVICKRAFRKKIFKLRRSFLSSHLLKNNSVTKPIIVVKYIK